MSDVLLQMKGIYKGFPGVQALTDAQFELRAGEVHALLGENGAGKSTLIKVLGGIYQADKGNISILGGEVTIRDVKDAQKKGISLIHQELMLVPHMTVAENIFSGREPLKAGLFVNEQKMKKDSQALLDAFGLQIDAGTLLGSLSIANQQMVEIIKAISFGAKIIVMDEPTSSLSDKEVGVLFEAIRKLRDEKIGIIYISHRLSELEEITDRITVMRDGKYIGTVETAACDKAQLISMMVGRELKNYYTRNHTASEEIALEVKNLSDGKTIEDISFHVNKGEILGFSGLIGSGRSEVMKCIFGIAPKKSGQVFIDGKEVQINTPGEALASGIGFVPENRKEEALYLQRSVEFNITINVLARFIKAIFVKRTVEADITNNYIDKMNIKATSTGQYIQNLSGGNQQKVIIGRWLAANPEILILDEPTRGVDVGNKAEIYKIIDSLAQEGMAIIMVSSELPEILNMSDRIVVMSHGRLSGIVNGKEADQESIMALATKEFE